VGTYIVVVSGASGSVYGLRLTERLLASGHAVTFIATDAGREVMAFETGFSLPAEAPDRALAAFLELPAGSPLRVARADDLFDEVASGSRASDAMIVAPASMGFVGSVAAGLAADLPERAADVMLKERRPLVLMPRETPLNLIHLRNLTALAEAGAVIVPAMPAFYHRPRSLDDQVNYVVGKVLDVLGIEHDLFRRWRE